MQKAVRLVNPERLQLSKQLFMRESFDKGLLRKLTKFYEAGAGSRLGPVVVGNCTDGQTYVLDGFHRVVAARRANMMEVDTVWHIDDEYVSLSSLICSAGSIAIDAGKSHDVIARKLMLSHQAAELSDTQASHVFGFAKGVWAKARKDVFGELTHG